MAAYIIALFLIVVVWGWYLIPKKAGAHKASTLNIGGRRPKVASPRSVVKSPGEITVVPVAGSQAGIGAPVPVVGGSRSGANARRRQVRSVLGALAVLTVAAALFTGSITWWLVHICFDGLLIIYYGLTMQLQDNQTAVIARAAPSDNRESQPRLRRVAGG